MAIESLTDRQAYMTAFGVPAVVNSVSITAIFDDPHLTQLDTNTSTPMLTCITSDITGATYGSTVVVASVPFSGNVLDVQHDGTGITVLMLRTA